MPNETGILDWRSRQPLTANQLMKCTKHLSMKDPFVTRHRLGQVSRRVFVVSDLSG